MPVSWSGPADVNIKLFNEQHQHIINYFYDLNQAIIANQAPEKIEEILNLLTAYTDYHFKAEEEYFDKYDYPLALAAEHKEEHQSCRKMIVELQNNCQANELKTAVILIKFLENWINNHVIGTDGKYRDFFNQRGVY